MLLRILLRHFNMLNCFTKVSFCYQSIKVKAYRREILIWPKTEILPLCKHKPFFINLNFKGRPHQEHMIELRQYLFSHFAGHAQASSTLKWLENIIIFSNVCFGIRGELAPEVNTSQIFLCPLDPPKRQKHCHHMLDIDVPQAQSVNPGSGSTPMK